MAAAIGVLVRFGLEKYLESEIYTGEVESEDEKQNHQAV